MATLSLNAEVQSLVAEYGVFWQLWPQFEQTHGERCLIGFEVELIGSHTSDLNHVDPACPTCHHVRSVLLAIADFMPGELTLNRNSLTDNMTLTQTRLCVCLSRQSPGSVAKYPRFLNGQKASRLRQIC